MAKILEDLALINLKNPEATATVISEMRANSPTSLSITNSFARMMHDKDFEIFSFIEGLRSPGINSRVVDPSSGYLDNPQLESKATLKGTHLEITKLRPGTNNYDRVLYAIQELGQKGREAAKSEKLPKSVQR